MTMQNGRTSWKAGAMFAVIFCGAVGLGLRLGNRATAVRAQQGKASEDKLAKQVTPFYCSIENSLSKLEREHKKQIAIQMEAARMETKELAGGYAFRFRSEAISLAEVADWVATERRCCPFFDMAIELEREDGPMWLKITGREGVKQFIRGEFQVLKLR